MVDLHLSQPACGGASRRECLREALPIDAFARPVLCRSTIDDTVVQRLACCCVENESGVRLRAMDQYPHERDIGPQLDQNLYIIGVPKGIRTPVTAVKGRCPRPLDDGDVAAAWPGI